jgi:hypothetical protein
MFSSCLTIVYIFTFSSACRHPAVAFHDRKFLPVFRPLANFEYAGSHAPKSRPETLLVMSILARLQARVHPLFYLENVPHH